MQTHKERFHKIEVYESKHKTVTTIYKEKTEKPLNKYKKHWTIDTNFRKKW